jgi:hypothetical protein
MTYLLKCLLILVCLAVLFAGFFGSATYLSYTESKNSCAKNIELFNSVDSNKEIKWDENGWLNSKCIIKLELKNDETVWINFDQYQIAVQP